MGLKRFTCTLDEVLEIKLVMVVFESGKHQVLWEEGRIRGTTATHKIPSQYMQFLSLQTRNELGTFKQLLLRQKMGKVFFPVLLNQPKLYRRKNLLSTYSIMLHTVNCQKHLASCWKCFISTLSLSWYLLLWNRKDK